MWLTKEETFHKILLDKVNSANFFYTLNNRTVFSWNNESKVIMSIGPEGLEVYANSYPQNTSLDALRWLENNISFQILLVEELNQ